MKIIQLTAENVKRLTAIEITPNGDLVEIAGDNGAGKTSILDAIWWALGGERVVQDDPIRHGETDAFVEVNLGELIVRRSWKETKKGVRSTLKVDGANGEQYASPQKMLDDLFGALTFDPLEFSRMKPREQRDLLMELCGVGEELAKLDASRKRLFDYRTEVNRELNRLKVATESYREDVRNLTRETIDEMEEVSIAGVAAELDKAKAEVRSQQDTRRELEEHEAALLNVDQEIIEAEEAVDEMKKIRQSLKGEISDRKDTVGGFKTTDVDAINSRLLSAESDNSFVRGAKEYAADLSDLENIENKSDGLTEQIEETDSLKSGHLAEAKFPIRDLEFSDDGVVFDGIPFEQCSSAEQLNVSTAIGMALNPKLRVLRITDGILLDQSNLEFLADMAKRRDFQIWIERVEAGTDAAILIEDGHVRETVEV